MTLKHYEFTVHVERKMRCVAVSLDDAIDYVNKNSAEPGETISLPPSLADITETPPGWESWHDHTTDAADELLKQRGNERKVTR